MPCSIAVPVQGSKMEGRKTYFGARPLGRWACDPSSAVQGGGPREQDLTWLEDEQEEGCTGLGRCRKWEMQVWEMQVWEMGSRTNESLIKEELVANGHCQANPSINFQHCMLPHKPKDKWNIIMLFMQY